MCSILKYKTCMGRNYDYEQSFDEEIRVIEKGQFNNSYKVIGVCTGFVKDYPLLYDGMNDQGLCCGALAFTGNAVYNPIKEGMNNIPSYDFVFRVLASFKTVDDLKKELDIVNITDESYSDQMPSSDLHWFACDEHDSIIIEQTKDGLNWYDGEAMTNNPPYPKQLKAGSAARDSMGNCPPLSQEYDTRGTETFGLLGDYTSEGRFARLTYLKNKMELSDNPFDDEVSAKHLLRSIEQVYGATPVEQKYEYTIYSVVYNMENLTMQIEYYDKNHPINGEL